MRRPGLEDYGDVWRFLPVLDPGVEAVLSRDLDSRLTAREAAAVTQWLEETSLPFHVMRDHPQHRTAIPAGMWGARRVGGHRDIVTSMQRLLRDVRLENKLHLLYNLQSHARPRAVPGTRAATRSCWRSGCGRVSGGGAVFTTPTAAATCAARPRLTGHRSPRGDSGARTTSWGRRGAWRSLETVLESVGLGSIRAGPSAESCHGSRNYRAHIKHPSKHINHQKAIKNNSNPAYSYSLSYRLFKYG